MNKPKLEDYTKGGSMIAPHGIPDYEAYSSALEKYSKYLEAKVKNLDIQRVSNALIAFSNWAYDNTANGEDFYDLDVHSYIKKAINDC